MKVYTIECEEPAVLIVAALFSFCASSATAWLKFCLSFRSMFLVFRECHNAQPATPAIVVTVSGAVTAQKIQKCLLATCIIDSVSQSKRGMEKNVYTVRMNKDR